MHSTLPHVLTGIVARVRDIVSRARTAGFHWSVAVVARPAVSRDRGQSTAEYALVLLGASAVALAFLAWATRTGSIGDLFDRIIQSVAGRVS